MDGLFGRYISSPLFTFRLGQEERDVTVHSGPLAALSPALDTLINGQMHEALERRASWPDVSVDTFTRLCEFAYMQDYTPPAFQQILHLWPFSDIAKSKKETKEKKAAASNFSWDHIPEAAPPLEEALAEEPEPDIPAASDDDLNGTGKVFELTVRQRKISHNDLRDAFARLEYIRPKSTYHFRPKRNEGPTQDFTPVLIGHAELYILADKYGIEPLRQLVLNKLYRTLAGFTVYETDVPCIIDFVKFVYENTPPLTGVIDPLRNLACHYVASILGQIGDLQAFKELLANGGDFVMDFWQLVWV